MSGDHAYELAQRFSRQLRVLVLMLRRAAAELPITSQQVSVLGSIEGGPRRMTELADEHGVRLPTMTAQINRLVRDGLVARGADVADARVVVVSLTGTGRERLEEARELRARFLAQRFAALSDQDRAAIEAALPALDRLFAQE